MVLALVEPGDVVIDAGAHIGSFTIPLAKKVGTTGKVLAFEPDPENYELLRRNIELNTVASQTQTFCGIVTNQPGKYNKQQYNAGNTGTYYFTADDVGEAVACHRLDDCGCGRVAFVKIDVEGMELSTLHSAQELIRLHRPAFYVEINGVALQRAGVSAYDIHAFFQDRNYVLYQNIGPRNAADDTYQVAEAPQPLPCDSNLMYDILAIPEERAAACLTILNHCEPTRE